MVVRDRDIAEVFPDVVWFSETTIAPAGPGPAVPACRDSSRDNGYKVVVTGEGADEVLAGYDMFREAQVRQFWARNPASAARGRAVELLYPWMKRSPRAAAGLRASFFGRNLDHRRPGAVTSAPVGLDRRADTTLLTADLRAGAGSVAPEQDLVGRDAARQRPWDPLSRAQWLELTTLLPGYILASQGDRMLMANSVEGRFPFLDRDVVQFANGLPARHKLFGLEEKYLLKRAFADLVPDDILQRPKQPYRAPDASSFFTADPPAWFAERDHDAERWPDAGIFEPRPWSRPVRQVRPAAGRAHEQHRQHADARRHLDPVAPLASSSSTRYAAGRSKPVPLR